MTSVTDTTQMAALLAQEHATLDDLLRRPGTEVVLLAGSKDPNAKVTLLLFDDYGPSFVVKVPTTRPAARVVRNEGYLLEALAERSLGRLVHTIPQLVGYLSANDLPSMVTTTLAGTPMTISYHAWRHTARRRKVSADFAAAAAWLADLQTRTAGRPAPVTLLGDALAAVAKRFRDDPDVNVLRQQLARASARLAGAETPRTVVHGDYWFGNVLTRGGRVTGVVDWESGEISGEPLRDVARFAVSYSLYLDRHTRPGRRVAGHRGLRADRWGAGLAHMLRGKGWYGTLVQKYVAEALVRLGTDPGLWREVLVAGVIEAAATADHPDFARAHLHLLAGVLTGQTTERPLPPDPMAPALRVLDAYAQPATPHPPEEPAVAPAATFGDEITPPLVDPPRPPQRGKEVRA